MRTQLKYSKTGKGAKLEEKKNKAKNVTFKIIKPRDTTRKPLINGRKSKTLTLKTIERNCMKCTHTHCHTHTHSNK